MTQRVPQPASEIQLARLGVDAELSVTAFDEGSTTFTLTRNGKSWAYSSTLGQAIQLRDFLNRHIDGLALQQTGSLAERASDGSDQLAAVEEVPTCTNSVDYFGGVYRCGMRSSFSRDPVLCPSCCEKQKR